MEQGLMRVYASKQVYRVIEIDSNTPFDAPLITEKYRHPELLIVPPTDGVFQQCQQNRQMVYGIFSLSVCVESYDQWLRRPPEYAEATLLVVGKSLLDVQLAAEEWFLANRDPLNEPRIGRYGTPQSLVLMPVHGRKPHVPKTPSS